MPGVFMWGVIPGLYLIRQGSLSGWLISGSEQSNETGCFSSLFQMRKVGSSRGFWRRMLNYAGHTHICKGFNACLSIPIHYQKPWFYAVKFILGTWTSGRELWQSQPHVSREARHVASAQACLEEMVSSFLLLVEATLPNATGTLHF